MGRGLHGNGEFRNQPHVLILYFLSFFIPLLERDFSDLDLGIDRDIWLAIFGEPLPMGWTNGEFEFILLSEVGLHVLAGVSGEGREEDEGGIGVVSSPP